MRYIVTLILLLRIEFNKSTSLTLNDNPGKQKTTIAIVSAKRESAAIESAINELKMSRLVNITQIKLFKWDNWNSDPKSSLVDFCEEVLSQNISAILITKMSDKFSFLPWISSRLGIPVSLVQNTRSFPATLESEYHTVLSMVPEVSEQSDALRGLLGFFKWTHFTIITTRQHLAGAETLLRKLTMPKQLQTVSLARVDPDNNTDLLNKLGEIKRSETVVIVLHCFAEEAKLILQAAVSLGVYNIDRVWIGTDHVMWGKSGVLGLPPGLLGLQLRSPCEDQEPGPQMGRLVYDSVMVYAHTINNGLSLKPSYGCYGNIRSSSHQVMRNILGVKINEGETGRIRFDLKGNRVGTEYDIMNLQTSATGRPAWNKIGYWSEGKISCNRSPIEWPGRRTSPPPNILHSKVLRIATAITEPFAYYSTLEDEDQRDDQNKVCAIGFPCKVYQPENNQTVTVRCCKGYAIDLLRMLENDVGFKAELHVVKDGLYGGQEPGTGQWNGLIGELLRGEADVAIADLTITDARSRVVDFTHPFLHVGMAILVAVYKNRSGWLVRFLEPFSTELWIVAVAAVNIVFVILWIIDKRSPYGHYRRGSSYKERKKFHMIASLWFTWGTIFHIDEVEARPMSNSSRTVTLVFAFGMLTLTNTYTASLAAVLVTEAEVSPVSSAGLRDPRLQNPQPGFKMATVRDTSMEKVFKGSTDPTFARIWRQMKPHAVNSFSDGVQKVINGELSAFIGDEPTLMYAMAHNRKCNLRLAGKSFFHSGFGIATRKNSSLTKKFSDVLILYEQFDTSRKMALRWLTGSCSQKSETTAFTRMSIKDLGGAYVITSIGLVLSLLVLAFEFYVDKYGFPYSYVWTNKPHPTWPSSRVLHKQAKTLRRNATSHATRHMSTAPLELSFGQRRGTIDDERDAFQSRDSYPHDMSELGSEYEQEGIVCCHGNKGFTNDVGDDVDSGLGSLAHNIESSSL